MNAAMHNFDQRPEAKGSPLRVEGRIANHDREFEGAIEINTDTGLIEYVGPITGKSDIDLAGQIVFPGFGDLHIHAREDSSQLQTYKEDFATASAASIHGGVTYVADMPNNAKAPIDDESYTEKETLTAKSAVHVTLYAGIGPATNPLARHVPYKVFMGPSVGDLYFASQAQLESVIERYRGKSVSFHCEDPVILGESKAAPTHEQRRPASAEIAATAFALYLIEKYELIGKLCHYSTKVGLEMIAAAKARGVRVTAEAAPHHLFFDDTMLTDENRKWLQANPPLRAREDRLALITALREGLVDYLATDHAPHTNEEKMNGMSGMPHLDTYGAFATWLMAKHGFSAKDIARVCAYNPGSFVNEFLPDGFGKGYGVIEPGYVGSLTILNLDAPLVVRREELKTKCGWSPFEGYTMPGRVTYTVLKGKVYRAG
jgi:dihydroorotase